jgi:hypothetical protein
MGVMLTNNHDVKVEAFADTLAVPLVGKVGEANVSSQLAADDISHITGSLSGGLWVFGADRLCGTLAHWIAALDIR